MAASSCDLWLGAACSGVCGAESHGGRSIIGPPATFLRCRATSKKNRVPAKMSYARGRALTSWPAVPAAAAPPRARCSSGVRRRSDRCLGVRCADRSEWRRDRRGDSPRRPCSPAPRSRRTTSHSLISSAMPPPVNSPLSPPQLPSAPIRAGGLLGRKLGLEGSVLSSNLGAWGMRSSAVGRPEQAASASAGTINPIDTARTTRPVPVTLNRRKQFLPSFLVLPGSPKSALPFGQHQPVWTDQAPISDEEEHDVRSRMRGGGARRTDAARLFPNAREPPRPLSRRRRRLHKVRLRRSWRRAASARWLT